MPFAEKAAEMAPAFVMGKVASARATGQNHAQAKSSDRRDPSDAELASRPNWELRDLIDFGYASRKAKAKRDVRDQPPRSDTSTSTASLQARIAADPALMPHLLAIKAQLGSDEVDALISAIASASEEERTNVLENIKALPVDAAVHCCRDIVAAIRKHKSTEAQTE
jgi:hypothetical protein